MMTAGLLPHFRALENESKRRELRPVVARFALASAALALIGASSGRFDGTAANDPGRPTAASRAKVSTIASAANIASRTTLHVSSWAPPIVRRSATASIRC